MRVTIHQPEFIPWLGFFHKASLADMLVVLDDAQFRKNYFQNRNRIRTAEGSVWVTVPVTRNLGTPINEVRIAAEVNPRWADRIENAVALAYRRAPHFESVQGGFVGCLRGAGETLVSLNIPLLRWMLEQFGLSKKVVLSSSLGTEARGSQRILDICKAVGATTYVSGVSGREYLDLEEFERVNIEVEFQEFHHPIYPQLHEPFVPQMSALEALFLFGPEGARLLDEGWPEQIETVFA